MSNAVVDDPDWLSIQSLRQLEVLKHSHACISMGLNDDARGMLVPCSSATSFMWFTLLPCSSGVITTGPCDNVWCQPVWPVLTKQLESLTAESAETFPCWHSSCNKDCFSHGKEGDVSSEESMAV